MSGFDPDPATAPIPAYSAQNPQTGGATPTPVRVPESHSLWGPSPIEPATASPPSRRNALILGGIGAVVLVGGAIALAAGWHSHTTTASGATPSLISAIPAEHPAAPAHSPAPPVGAPPAIIPGYQVVTIADHGAAYDIPPGWTIDPAGTVVWGSGRNPLRINGLSQDGKNYCPDSTRTSAFLTTSALSDPAAAAIDVGNRMAAFGWTNATLTPARPAEPLVSLNSRLHGAFVETSGSAPAPAPGCAGTFSIYTFAFPSESGNFVMTVAADTGVDKSLDRDTAKHVLASVRPVPEHP